jgi:ankyrin repeat protein
MNAEVEPMHAIKYPSYNGYTRAEELLKHDADVNFKNVNGYTFLHTACSYKMKNL